MQLLVGFSITGSVLTLVGVYGMLSLSVAARRREIAIRAAVGAQQADIRNLVLGQGLERTSGTDTAALQAAAAAMFAGNGPSLGTRVAQRIGLDDLSIRSGSGGGSASGLDSHVLAFSKRLTDRLYVVYEAGISVINNALRLEYALSRSFTLRAQAGHVSGVGIYFLRSFQ